MEDDPPDSLQPLDPPDYTTEQIEDILTRDANARFEKAGIVGMTKPVKLVFLDHPFEAIAKLPSAELPEAAHDQMCANEAAVYIVARTLGLEFVNPTVVRVLPKASGGAGRVSVQLWDGDAVKPAGVEDLATVDIDTVREAAAFDYAVEQVDRVGRNWLLVPNGDGSSRLLLIDHGLTFNVDIWAPPITGQPPLPHHTQGARSDIIDYVASKGLGPEYAVLAPLLEVDLDALLGHLLGADLIAAFRVRVSNAVSQAQIG